MHKWEAARRHGNDDERGTHIWNGIEWIGENIVYKVTTYFSAVSALGTARDEPALFRQWCTETADERLTLASDR